MGQTNMSHDNTAEETRDIEQAREEFNTEITEILDDVMP